MFCECESEPCTLVRYGLWPATAEKPQTAYSISLLELLLSLSMECQVSVEGFCNAMRWKNSLYLSEVNTLHKGLVGEAIARFHHHYFRQRTFRDLCAQVDDGTPCPACPKKAPPSPTWSRPRPLHPPQADSTRPEGGANPPPPRPSFLSGLCDFEHNLCGWTHDSLHRPQLGPAQRRVPLPDRAPARTSLWAPMISGTTCTSRRAPRPRGSGARLVSPEVSPETGPVCLRFSYQLRGEGVGTLRILLRDTDQDETLLWALKGDRGPTWKEGRTILPRSPKEFQVVMEGFFDHSNRGHIWLDNIHISSSTPLEQCTQPSNLI
ncbi:hypothetical protein SKAU_G00008610 [Synaphobranchus kaupii]|uniref:MAM domain-containing protein n=1 Tax=Synaphobranchus kaupii TaxID=118154 RepID=A0A9Q1JBY3_SYNKA|nr:hypothetical protein SKAU_G00008610 [Synaphobranchus kaupii]